MVERISLVKDYKKLEQPVAWGKLLVAILLCEATGIVSGFIGSASNNSWFISLHKPSWNPPSWLFAPVWSTLYLLMGISLWLIWKSKKESKQPAILVFALQLFLNFWWSILFFRFQSPAFAFVDIILLWLAILGTILLFARISKLSAWLLVPYISWVTFASILNFKIWVLNG